MAGYKDFSDGNVLTADEVDGYLMRQSVMRFTTTAALVAALGAGVRTGGMLAWADSTATLYQYSGSGGLWLPEMSLWKTSFVPTLSAPTALVIGNGSLTCRWRYSGGRVIANYDFVRGSTTNAGSATYFFNTPVTAVSATAAKGYGLIRRAAPAEHFVSPIPVSTTAFALLVASTGTRASNAIPAAVATNDAYSFTVEFEPEASTAGGAIS